MIIYIYISYIIIYIIWYIYIIYIHMSLLGMVSNLHEFLGWWIRFLKPMMKSGCLVEISMDWIPMVISPDKLLALQWFVGLNLSCKIMKQVLVASKKTISRKNQKVPNGSVASPFWRLCTDPARCTWLRPWSFARHFMPSPLRLGAKREYLLG